MIEIIEDEKKWNSMLALMPVYDFYHTYEYHYLLKKKKEKPILISYQSDGLFILFPFIKRKVNNTYFDLTSIHGYLGPVIKGDIDDFDLAKFSTQFIAVLKKNNVVSVFSKLNPYIRFQKDIINTLGNIQTIGEVIYFDQSLSDEEQLGQYNRNTRQKIRQIREVCTIKEANNKSEIANFIKIYHQGMKRLEAKEIFFFDEEYFDTLLNSRMFHAKILLAINKKNKEIMGGVFCTISKNIAHVELACTNTKYFKESPVRILFDEARILFKELGAYYLNLGGGAGGRDGSLMRFKSSFTKNYRDFEIWKFIVDEVAYHNLQTQEQLNDRTDFFPKYRLEIN